MRARLGLAAAISAIILAASADTIAHAQAKYDVGAGDTEIKLGTIGPFSGPVSIASIVHKAIEAYFAKINKEGGINGRKIRLVMYDDAYNPSKTLEQARKLVEGDEVLAVFATMGTSPSLAIREYMNARKVPQLFVITGASKFNDPKNYPWTMGFSPAYDIEGRLYAKYLLKEKPNAKIAVLYQNDDFGRDLLKGLKAGLGDKASLIVAESSYEPTVPTIDGHITNLKSKGADTFFNFSTPKFAAQAIKKMGELEWKPLHFLNSGAASIAGVIKPAGFEYAQGIITAQFQKDPTDPRWKDDPGMRKYDEFLNAYMQGVDRNNIYLIWGFNIAQTMVAVLKNAGSDLTRDNVLKQAASLNNPEILGLLPGVKLVTGPSDYAPISQLQLARIKGQSWELFGSLLEQ